MRCIVRYAGDMIRDERSDADTHAGIPLVHGASDDFDFFAGDWNVHNRRLRSILRGCDEWIEQSGTVSCRKIVGGLANVDDFRMTAASGELLATTLRLFNPTSRQWSIYWAATSRDLVLEPPVVGGFTGDEGLFYGPDTYDGVPILLRFIWRRAAKPTWAQAFSIDDGRTWETNWTMTFERAKKPGA